MMGDGWENARLLCSNQQAGPYVRLVSCSVLVTYVHQHACVQICTLRSVQWSDHIHATSLDLRSKLIKACFNNYSVKNLGARTVSHLIQEFSLFLHFSSFVLRREFLMSTEVASQKSNSLRLVCAFYSLGLWPI